MKQTTLVCKHSKSNIEVAIHKAALLMFTLRMNLTMQLIVLSLLAAAGQGFVLGPSATQQSRRTANIARFLGPFDFFGGSSGGWGSTSGIPKSPSDRDKQAIEAVKAAIKSPKTPDVPLIECEFPPLEALNKLGDGSLRSANLVDDANLAFGAKLVQGLSPFAAVMGPKVWFLTSTTSSPNFIAKATKLIKGAQAVQSLRDGVPEGLGEGDICIVMAPSVRQDYLLARSIASSNPVVVVNGLAKDQKSIGGEATMAYFLKPLTYNSQIVGYLARKYPNDWTTVDLVSKAVLSTYTDSDILFGKTNTPDLRDAGRRVQKAVDERAILARQR